MGPPGPSVAMAQLQMLRGDVGQQVRPAVAPAGRLLVRKQHTRDRPAAPEGQLPDESRCAGAQQRRRQSAAEPQPCAGAAIHRLELYRHLAWSHLVPRSRLRGVPSVSTFWNHDRPREAISHNSTARPRSGPPAGAELADLAPYPGGLGAPHLTAGRCDWPRLPSGAAPRRGTYHRSRRGPGSSSDECETGRGMPGKRSRTAPSNSGEADNWTSWAAYTILETVPFIPRRSAVCETASSTYALTPIHPAVLGRTGPIFVHRACAALYTKPLHRAPRGGAEPRACGSGRSKEADSSHRNRQDPGGYAPLNSEPRSWERPVKRQVRSERRGSCNRWSPSTRAYRHLILDALLPGLPTC